MEYVTGGFFLINGVFADALIFVFLLYSFRVSNILHAVVILYARESFVVQEVMNTLVMNLIVWASVVVFFVASVNLYRSSELFSDAFATRS